VLDDALTAPSPKGGITPTPPELLEQLDCAPPELDDELDSESPELFIPLIDSPRLSVLGPLGFADA
jgi:hypothetical protein